MLRDNNSTIVVLITCGNRREAEKITDVLVTNRLIACGNILSNVTSIFRWDDRITNEEEVLVIAKTHKSRFDQLLHKVKKMHSYSTPEVIGLPIVAGSAEYLNWIVEETSDV